LIDELCDFEKELSSAELLAFCSLRQSGDLTLMSLEGTVMTFSLLLADLSAPPSTDVSLALSTPDGVVVDCGSGVTLNLMQEKN
jgi:hypothetical protein